MSRFAAISPGVPKMAGLLQAQLFGAPAAEVDYLHPAGDPGLYGPDSMAWRVHANPITLAIGGVAAVILELGEPRVRTGVWEHSTFRTDPLRRMQRTGEAALAITYAPTAAAKARIAQIGRMHQPVAGVTPEGEPYSALDPELMAWVHVTAGYGFLNAHLRHLEPKLGRAEQDRYYAEAAEVGRAFGAQGLPTSVSQVEAYLESMRPRLRPHPIIQEFLRIVATTSPRGLPGRVVQPLLVQASVDLLPAWVRVRLGLPSQLLLSASAGALMRALARAARLAPGEIPRQAYARMGRRMP